jgi:ADP-ribose pyrophosphatase YjhB (NUDIX family)
VQPVTSAGGIVIGPDGRLVIVKQPKYAVCWSLPKGKQQPGESLRDTARRKIAEETGLSHLTFIRAFKPYDRGRVRLPGEPLDEQRKTLHFFLCTTAATEFHPHSSAIDEVRWVTREEAITLLTHPNDQRFLESADLTI